MAMIVTRSRRDASSSESSSPSEIMNAVQGSSKKTLEKPKDESSSKESDTKKRIEDDLEGLPVWVF